MSNLESSKIDILEEQIEKLKKEEEKRCKNISRLCYAIKELKYKINDVVNIIGKFEIDYEGPDNRYYNLIFRYSDVEELIFEGAVNLNTIFIYNVDTNELEESKIRYELRCEHAEIFANLANIDSLTEKITKKIREYID